MACFAFVQNLEEVSKKAGPRLRKLDPRARGSHGSGSRNLRRAFFSIPEQPSDYEKRFISRGNAEMQPRNEIVKPQKGGRKPWSSSATRTTTTKGKQKSAVSTNGGGADVANNNVVVAAAVPKISDGAPRWWTSTKSSSAAAAR